MKKLLQTSLKGLLLVPALVFGLSFLVPVDVSAQGDNVNLRGGRDAAQTEEQPDNLFAQDGVFRTIVNILLFLVGAVAVIMLVIGGFRYVLSGGDQNAVTSAKNTILYAIIGIVIAILAYAAVEFVSNQFLAN
jgi:hypothetical protein